MLTIPYLISSMCLCHGHPMKQEDLRQIVRSPPKIGLVVSLKPETPNRTYNKELAETKANCCVASCGLCMGQNTALEHTSGTTADSQLAHTVCPAVFIYSRVFSAKVSYFSLDTHFEHLHSFYLYFNFILFNMDITLKTM